MNSEQITSKADDITLESAPVSGPAAATTFCDLWPSARQGLDMLKSMIKNPIAKGSISVVIAAGDAVASRKCPS